MNSEQDASKRLQLEFRLREYDALLDKIAHTRTDVSRLETIYPLAIATIYAWTFTNQPAIFELWMATMVLPVAIAVLAIVRLYSRQQGMALLEEYLREIETEVYGDDSRLGWERRYAAKRPLKCLIRVRAGLAIAILLGTFWMVWNAAPYFDESQRKSTSEKATLESKSDSVAQTAEAVGGRGD